MNADDITATAERFRRPPLRTEPAIATSCGSLFDHEINVAIENPQEHQKLIY